jgi:hypothetical protein
MGKNLGLNHDYRVEFRLNGCHYVVAWRMKGNLYLVTVNGRVSKSPQKQVLKMARRIMTARLVDEVHRL